MTDEELREMVRASIARLAAGGPQTVEPAAATRRYAGFARLPFLSSGDAEGRCLIEPTVRCNQCGYCLSYGH